MSKTGLKAMQEFKKAITSQYLAALTMLRQTISECDDDLWFGDAYQHQFWWLSYHILFYADYYTCLSPAEFVPWRHHVEAFEGWQSLDPRTLRARHMPVTDKPYQRKQILEYADLIFSFMPQRVEQAELTGHCGFERFDFSRLELHIYNIRHIQHHTGQLALRLREDRDKGTKWIGSTPLE